MGLSSNISNGATFRHIHNGYSMTSRWGRLYCQGGPAAQERGEVRDGGHRQGALRHLVFNSVIGNLTKVI